MGLSVAAGLASDGDGEILSSGAEDAAGVELAAGGDTVSTDAAAAPPQALNKPAAASITANMAAVITSLTKRIQNLPYISLDECKTRLSFYTCKVNMSI